MSEFEIKDGARTLTFKITPIEVEAQLELLALIGPVVTVLVNAIRGGSEPPAHIMASLKTLPEILRVFEGRTVVEGFTSDPSFIGEAKPMPLKAIRKELFRGKIGLLLTFIVQAVKGELSDFLPGSGRGLESLSEALGFSFPWASIGGSGESPATLDSD